MIIYTKNQQTLEKNTFLLDQSIPIDTVWIDITNITPEEELKLEQHFKINIPNLEETKNVSISNRLYEEQEAIYMTIALYLAKDSNICNLKADNITFIITKGILITLREVDSDLFNNILNYISQKNILSKNTCFSLLLILLKNIINNTSAFLENIGHFIDIQNDNIVGCSPDHTELNKVNYKTLLKFL